MAGRSLPANEPRERDVLTIGGPDRKPDDDGGGLSIETSREPVPVG